MFTNIEGYVFSVKAVAFSPDSKQLASPSHDHRIQHWGAASGLKTITGKTSRPFGQVIGVAFSPDGKQLASASWITRSGSGTRYQDPHRKHSKATRIG